MKKFVDKKNNITTEYEFVLSDTLPKDLPILTPITFAFIGMNVVLVQKQNDWWDVIGGKIENSENWKEALKRGSKEEAGVNIDDIEIVGYVLVKNSKSGRFSKDNILPVTMSFVKEVLSIDLAPDVKKREAYKISEAKEVLNARKDNGQLLEIFGYVVKHYELQDYEFEFEYVKAEDSGFARLPITQVMVFVRDSDGLFIAVRDEGEGHYSLPGGGCYVDEAGEDCAQREVREEAQCQIKDLELLGNVIVKVQKDGKILSKSRQARYFARLDTCSEFIPNKFEIAERRFVDLNFLSKNTRVLNNDTGKDIIKDLKSKL